MVVAKTIDQPLVEVVIPQTQFGNGTNNGDFPCVGKGRPSRSDAKVAELHNAAPLAVDLEKTIAAMPMLFDKVEEVRFKLLKLERVPYRGRCIHFNEFQRTDGTSLDPWRAVRFEKNGVNVLHQQRLEVVGKRGVVTMGCHQGQGCGRRPLTLRPCGGGRTEFRRRVAS